MPPSQREQLSRSFFTNDTDDRTFYFAKARDAASGRWRAVSAMCRLVGMTVWVPLSVGFEAILLLVPGTAKVRWTRVIWRGMCALLGVRLKTIGEAAAAAAGKPARDRGERPVIYVSNHCSWLDVPALGSRLYGVFVAKAEIGSWYIMGITAKIGRTIFVSRLRSTTGRERDEMVSRLAAGDNLVLFPEGTSSDGQRVLPFSSTFFAIAKPPRLSREMLPLETAPSENLIPLIQPISLVYDRLEGLPVTRGRRSLFAWYGDMYLGPHVWRFLRWRGKRATILFHPPLKPEDYPSRKALSNAAWLAVARGVASLRQDGENASGWMRPRASIGETRQEC